MPMTKEEIRGLSDKELAAELFDAALPAGQAEELDLLDSAAEHRYSRLLAEQQRRKVQAQKDRLAQKMQARRDL